MGTFGEATWRAVIVQSSNSLPTTGEKSHTDESLEKKLCKPIGILEKGKKIYDGKIRGKKKGRGVKRKEGGRENRGIKIRVIILNSRYYTRCFNISNNYK